MTKHFRRRWLRRFLWTVLPLAAVAFFLYFGVEIYRWSNRTAAEYNTVSVIREVSEFVAAHNGQWPQSWNDLPRTSPVRLSVRMRFDVDTVELIDDPELIHTVITPISGEYRTYPHARMNLEELRDILAEHRQ